MKPVLAQTTLTLKASLKLLAEKQRMSVATYVAAHCDQFTAGSGARDKRYESDLIAFASLFRIDQQVLDELIEQFHACGLYKTQTIKVALAELVLTCLSVHPRFKTLVRWMGSTLDEYEGTGPVPEQNDIGS